MHACSLPHCRCQICAPSSWLAGTDWEIAGGSLPLSICVVLVCFPCDEVSQLEQQGQPEGDSLQRAPTMKNCGIQISTRSPIPSSPSSMQGHLQWMQVQYNLAAARIALQGGKILAGVESTHHNETQCRTPAWATKSRYSGRESPAASYSTSLSHWLPRSHRRIADRGLICLSSLPASSTLTTG